MYFLLFQANSEFLKNRKCMLSLHFWILGSSRWYTRAICVSHLSVVVGGICPALKHLLYCIKRTSHLWLFFFFKLLSTMTLPFCSWLSLTPFFHLPSVNPQATHISCLAVDDLTIHMTVQKWGILASPRCISTFFFFSCENRSQSWVFTCISRETQPLPFHFSLQPQPCHMLHIILPPLLIHCLQQKSLQGLPISCTQDPEDTGYQAVQLNSLFPIFPKSEFCHVHVLERQETWL